MFSSSNSGNPFQHLPSLFHQSPPFVGHESDDIFLHHHNDLLVGHFPPANASLAEAVINMAVSNNPIMTNQDVGRINQDYYGPSNFLPGKRAVKKDRHSKITTAKGPRERRVRLSIKIARKFFDLQDMLGFDKASRTLEWLLMKSKTAIKEVVRMKHSCNEEAKSLSSASECEVVSEMNDAAESGDPQEILFRRKSPGWVSKEKKMKESNKAAFHLLARESRAKARARARERTREKMCTRRLDELKKFPDANHPILSQLRSSCQFQTHEKLGSHTHNMASSLKLVGQVEESSSRPLANHTQREDIIEESIVIKRKLKPSPIFACPQNLLFSKDLSLGNSNSYFPHPPQNWDINTPSARSSFCAMTNMNLSTGIPWEQNLAHFSVFCFDIISPSICRIPSVWQTLGGLQQSQSPVKKTKKPKKKKKLL